MGALLLGSVGASCAESPPPAIHGGLYAIPPWNKPLGMPGLLASEGGALQTAQWSARSVGDTAC
ncbi:hypothetical protein IP93_01746 [Lysobacter ruishenii]|uniref:Uncharacterized protein n=1 Tax=Aerolutibacter ruishenii TaxID=686800 RepID=A0A562LSS2_9GAMM|nr:hypothetical protein IP93_01746 [Lysobacter ruishenii]